MKALYSFSMRIAFAVCAVILCSNANSQTLTAHPNVAMTSNCRGFYDYTPAGYNPSGSQTYPVLIAFGGISQNGDGSAAQLDRVFSNWGGPGWQVKNGRFPSSITVNGQVFRFLVIFPQFSSGASPKGVDDVISYVLSHYKADPTRVYLTGNSLGGGYCWDYPGASVAYAQRVAAVVPTCAAAGYSTAKATNIAAANLPVWATHNAVDNSVSPNTTRTFVNGINGLPSPPNPRAKMTIFNAEGHNCADATFNMTTGIGAYAWMLQYKRGSTTVPVPNQTPVARAGNDVTLVLPSNSTQLNGNGSYDNDGTVTYSWSKTAGPSQFSINNANVVNPVLSNLVAGTYTLRLTVTDDKSATATDDINIYVNASQTNTPPVANAGADVSIQLPANSVTLTGTGSDPDGSISAYQWTKYSGPAAGTIGSPSQAQSTMSNLAEGTYVFQLKVTDNKNATATDLVQVTVRPAGTSTGTKSVMVNVFGGSSPYNNTAWNNWNVGSGSVSNITSATFNYSDGSASGINAILSSSQAVGDNAANYPGGMAPAEVLRHTSYSQQARTLTISGLSTALKYDIELYSSRWSSGNNTVFSVNGTSVTIASFRNFSTKAVFAGLTPNAQGRIVVNIQSATNYNYLNGFMITQKSSTGVNSTRSGETIVSTPLEDAATVADARRIASVQFFPNPVTDKVIMQVNNPERGLLKVQVMNVNGAIQKQLTVQHGTAVSNVDIPMNDLPRGMYIIKVQLGSWSASKKVVK